MPGAKQNLNELIDRPIEASEDDLLKLLDESPNEIYVFDKKSLQFVYVNGSARTNLGYSLEELAELTPIDLKPEYNLASFRERIAPLLNGDSKKLQFETTHQRKNGSIYPAEVHLQLAHYRNRQVCTASILDITTRKEQEEERRNFDQKMQQSQKLESLGILAGGVAHDFNNILTSILGYSDLAQQSLTPGMPANDYMSEIVKGALQASELIRQMLDYSGKGKFIVEPIDLSALVDDMGRLLEVSISRKCVLKYYSAPNLPSIEADISQVRQVIMNLVINASESIAEHSGVIAISTGAMFCDSDYLSETYLDENLPEGLYVYLEVADTGQGMDEETRLKIFDPFFTTKFTGRGLGLAAILGIVRGHRGGINVYSELDKGTTFKVLLPACSQQPASELELEQENNSPDWKASGTVLVVDDEESLLALARQQLENMGFSVLTATDGRNAVEIFREHSDDIDLVLLDMIMPHLDGVATFREMRRIRNNVPTILSSGYNKQTATAQFTGKGLAGFIQKPYRYSQLMEVVRDVLESG